MDNGWTNLPSMFKTGKWEYALNSIEEAICVEVGYQRQKPYFGDPSKNISYSEGDLWELWQHAVAAGAELALARMLGNYEFKPHFNKWKSIQDLPNTCEVRYTFNQTTGLRITKRDDPNSIYVLLVDGLAIKNRTNKLEQRLSTPYKALGWIYGHQAINDKFASKYQDTWYVPVQYLNMLPKSHQ